jgi:hypothetical protein
VVVLVYPSWTNIDVLTTELAKTAGNNTEVQTTELMEKHRDKNHGSDYRAK